MRALEEVLAPDRPKEGFVVDTLNRAMWASRKLQAIRKKEAEAHAEAKAQMNLIVDWLQGVTDECAQEASYFEGLLAPWVLPQLTKRSRSVKLPGAVLGFRAGGKTVVYDEATLVAWAKAHRPEFVRVKEEVAKSEVAQAVITDGEVLRDDDGALLVSIEQKPDTFYVKFSEAKGGDEE